MNQSFKEKVLEVVRSIPIGSVLTYKQVAKLAGNEKAARAVGSIMSKNYNKEIPCHRVIGSNGKLNGYNRGGPTKKLAILKSENKFFHLGGSFLTVTNFIVR